MLVQDAFQLLEIHPVAAQDAVLLDRDEGVRDDLHAAHLRDAAKRVIDRRLDDYLVSGLAEDA